MNDLTILIKTFERPDCLVRILTSIDKYQPGTPVIIADDSANSSRKKVLSRFSDMIVEFVDLPFDSGVSRGRNRLLDRVTTPYFVLCDDDLVFHNNTNLLLFRKLLERHNLDILGGLWYDVAPDLVTFTRTLAKGVLSGAGRTVLEKITPTGRKHVFEGTMALHGDVLICNSLAYSAPVTMCDYTHNFFVARTKVVREVLGGWDENLKINEHLDFFIRAKNLGLRVATTHEVSAKHAQTYRRKYLSFRHGRDFRDQVLTKHNLAAIISDSLHGRETVVLGDRK